MFYLEHRNVNEVENSQFRARWERTSPDQINFLCHFPVGNCSIIDPVADDGGIGSRRIVLREVTVVQQIVIGNTSTLEQDLMNC